VVIPKNCYNKQQENDKHDGEQSHSGDPTFLALTKFQLCEERREEKCAENLSRSKQGCTIFPKI
jgi:hypothetical protein